MLTDPSAIIALIGLIVSTVVALLSAAEKENRRRTFTLLAVLGFAIGAAAIWWQHLSGVEAKKDRDEAQRKLAGIETAVSKAADSLNDLRALNQLSPNSRYHVRLSVDKDVATACRTARRLTTLFPEAIENGSIGVVRRPDHNQPYHLLFGKSLSLAATDIFQRTAVSNGYSAGWAPIELEREEQSEDCDKVLQGAI